MYLWDGDDGKPVISLLFERAGRGNGMVWYGNGSADYCVHAR